MRAAWLDQLHSFSAHSPHPPPPPHTHACRTIDGNTNLAGFLPKVWKQRVFNMAYVIDVIVSTGEPVRRGPDNYGLGGGTLYTGSGPLWRTKVINWEGEPDNSATNPNPQPRPDPCAAVPPANVC